MQTINQKLLLADDDPDDCIFFKEALEDLPVFATLETVNDGVELMHLLSTRTHNLPDVLFLDLNMPRKTGFECLSEIKADDKLKHITVIIFSTSLGIEVVNLLYENGAHYCIRKPAEFSKLKKVIHEALIVTSEKDPRQPAKEKFILQA